MEKIVRKVYESNKGLPYRRLQKELGMPNETFRKSINKLRELNIPEKPSSKEKKIPIRFAPDVRGKYPFIPIPIPHTYLPAQMLADKEHKRGPEIRMEDTRRTRHETYSRRRGIILQYFLLRAALDTTYARIVVDPSEQCKAGQILIYQDTAGHSYSSGDIQTTLTEKQIMRLIQKTLETDSIAGVSPMDLVLHRDIGSDGVSSDVDTSIEECVPILEDHVQKGILVPIGSDEVYDSIAKTADPERYMPLLKETRYRIASEILKRFVEDWDCLRYYVIRCLEAKWRITKKRNREERDFYDYCNGFNALNRLWWHQKVAYDKISKAEKNKGRVEVQSPDGMQIEYQLSKKELYEAWMDEFEVWARLVLTKSDEIRSKQEYFEITSKYPFLGEMLNNTSRPIPKILRIKKDPVR